MAHSYKRSARISDLLIKEISEMLVRGKIKDPRVSSVSITAVRVTDDMGYAKVFFTSFDEHSDTQEMLEGLKNATGYIRNSLLKKLRIKKIPNIEFEYDALVEKRARIDELIRGVSDE
ncbi:MAG: 30S ribosome-binding factor RbfA [Candidatus Dadabacteria bacterium]|nr:30S ribosome-binding factor RbfA [Candidatus Dadabacteria bacterium]MYA48262.1 30S ribosome-binding factor RbfA [Candidatus Dadabacteria bacterium]MYF48166.1 30S ribosome-binding factor RbfA [Candidatus Dadabacteria bacterium]MYG82238.1 30S ribosome-binding factor RbfA [Candidatus Dadabacteria bacterium]MYK49839.1 30S ribosome-binding factor RbfA [Candidatus Dadabacteria bacterium]